MTRHLLRMLGLFLGVVCVRVWAGAAAPESADILVYGGTSGGVIAAVQAAAHGKSVLLIEPGKHLGGLTSGGLGATDYGKKDSIGGLAREFYQRIKKYYANPKVWKYESPTNYVSHGYDPKEDTMWAFEPHVAEQIYADWLRAAGVKVVYQERLELKNGVKRQGQRIDTLVMESGRAFRAAMFIDATYEGDLMAKAGVSYAVGREANSVYQETVNGVSPAPRPPKRLGGSDFFRPVDPYVKPGDPSSGLLHGVQPGPLPPAGTGDRGVQAYNFRICMTEVPENRVPFAKPADYDPAKYELMLRYLCTEGTTQVYPDNPPPREIEHPGLGYRPYIVIMPNRKTDMNTKGAVSSDYVGMNWDYPDGDYATRERIIREHASYQQGMMWFLQHDPRVPKIFREPLQSWGLAKDEFTDNNHWPQQLYVREARRMISDYVMTEHDCRNQRTAPDSIGLASYGMDSHFIRRYVDEFGHVQNEGNAGGGGKPYPLSYRAIIPKRGECENLLVPICLAASHVAYGSIRMEPVFMILGQSAATAAAQAIDAHTSVQDLPYPPLRARLLADHQRLDWVQPKGK